MAPALDPPPEPLLPPSMQPPLVVGTVRPDGLARLASLPASERGADVIEARFDLALPASAPAPAPLPDLSPFFPACDALERTGSPVLGTIRLVADGGRWPDDAGRLSWFERIVAVVSSVDVEVESAIAPAVVAAARERQRQVIVSHHDFAGTPALDVLEAIVSRAVALGADIVKLATMVRGPDDHDLLLELLRRHRAGLSSSAPPALALVGMGPNGTALRAYLPCVGSRLTYGFLDQTAAPGQLAAPELVRRLRTDCPAYSGVHPEPERA